MEWLDVRLASGQETLTYGDLAQFVHDGVRIPLIDPQRGIRKPRGVQAALAIRTTYTPAGRTPPYFDAGGPDGLLRYKYRGEDPNQFENVALRRALEERLPLVWFVGVAPDDYLPVYPVWIVAEEPTHHQFVVAFDVAQRLLHPGESGDLAERRYVERLTKQRLHQPVFRLQVLRAYREACALCRLKYPSLLDAAHILPDGHPRGIPEVSNGLSLCKIHHAAFDQNLIGVRPDLVVEVRSDVRSDSDGPMLLHGIQEMDGVHLSVPRSKAARPDQSRLEERYEEFRRAS